jgi:hypothetical protein
VPRHVARAAGQRRLDAALLISRYRKEAIQLIGQRLQVLGQAWSAVQQQRRRGVRRPVAQPADELAAIRWGCEFLLGVERSVAGHAG